MIADDIKHLRIVAENPGYQYSHYDKTRIMRVLDALEKRTEALEDIVQLRADGLLFHARQIAKDALEQ